MRALGWSLCGPVWALFTGDGLEGVCLDGKGLPEKLGGRHVLYSPPSCSSSRSFFEALVFFGGGISGSSEGCSGSIASMSCDEASFANESGGREVRGDARGKLGNGEVEKHRRRRLVGRYMLIFCFLAVLYAGWPAR